MFPLRHPYLFHVKPSLTHPFRLIKHSFARSELLSKTSGFYPTEHLIIIGSKHSKPHALQCLRPSRRVTCPKYRKIEAATASDRSKFYVYKHPLRIQTRYWSFYCLCDGTCTGYWYGMGEDSTWNNQHTIPGGNKQKNRRTKTLKKRDLRKVWSYLRAEFYLSLGFSVSISKRSTCKFWRLGLLEVSLKPMEASGVLLLLFCFFWTFCDFPFSRRLGFHA